MFGNLFQRSILRELFKVFALALTALTAILVLVGLLVQAVQYGLSPAEFLAIIPLIIPSLMPYAIPAATLYTACQVYGRLARDSELVALTSAGISPLTLVWPGVLLGVVAGCATLGLYYEVIPTTQYMLRSRCLAQAEVFFYRLLKTQRCLDLPGSGYTLWVRDVEGRRLLDATFKRHGQHGGYDLVGHAGTAELSVDPRTSELLVHMQQGAIVNPTNGNRAYFHDYTFPLPGPDWATARERRLREQTMPQLVAQRDAIRSLIARCHSIPTESEDAECCESASRPESERYAHRLLASLRAVDRELTIRPAVAFGCLCFVLIGCPIGIFFRSGDYLTPFVTCFLPIITCYYPLLLCGIKLSDGGEVHPVLALWAGNALLLAVAVVLLRKQVRN